MMYFVYIINLPVVSSRVARMPVLDVTENEGIYFSTGPEHRDKMSSPIALGAIYGQCT